MYRYYLLQKTKQYLQVFILVGYTVKNKQWIIIKKTI